MFKNGFRQLAIFLTLSSALIAGQAEDDNYPPGLLGRYTAGGKDTERVDPDVQFAWGEHSPDARMLAGPFEVYWSGKTLIRAAGKYRFHLYLQGEAVVSLNGKTVVKGSSEKPGWIDGPEQTLDFGEQKIEITFGKTEENATIKLCWSSDTFPVEPIPPQVLFRDMPRPDLQLIERGRDVYEAHRCNRCHVRENEALSAPSPALTHTSVGLNREWFAAWLLKPQEQTPHARMPQFGFTKAEADAVAAFVLSVSSSVTVAPVEKSQREQDARQGETLFRSLGCLACHSHGDQGTKALFNGGDLTTVGRKRSAEWLAAWLAAPEKLIHDHRMPVFKLTNDERRQLALFLAGENAGAESKPAAPDAKLITEGRTLVMATRCANCHHLPYLAPETKNISTLEEPIADWSKSCIAGEPDRKTGRPTYTLSKEDAEAVTAFVKSRHLPLTPESSFTLGLRLLKQKNCLACHERDGSRGIAAIAGAMANRDTALQGQSAALIPPDLTAVGDKLHDKALAEAVSGEQPRVRMPWLRVRMPRFQHSPAEKEAVLAYLIGHDRIPDRPGDAIASLVNEATKPVPPDETPLEREKRIKDRKKYSDAGQQLVGTKGLSCSACHKVGQFEPRNVALGTRGSDLYLLGDRMRREYFLRWTRSPLRIIPGMEMPSYEKPVARLLDGKIDTQLVALWDALNDEQSTIPVDGTILEQVVIVAPGERAKIIRDVFNVGTPEKLRWIPRAFAVGFDNGTNLLLDLDTMSLQHTWTGDLARQRASGKSWYWEPGTPQPTVQFRSSPDIVLVRKGDTKAPAIIAEHNNGCFGRLNSYQSDQDRVTLEYELNFRIDGRAAVVRILEILKTTQRIGFGEWTAWLRSVILLDGVPSGFEAVVLKTQMPEQLGVCDLFSETPKWRTIILPVGNERITATASPPIVVGEEIKNGGHVVLAYKFNQAVPASAKKHIAPDPKTPEKVTSIPGYDGVRLPLDGKIMPTAITWTPDGTLAFCSLKGQVYLVKDSDGDGVEDKLILFEEGLAAPYGLIADGIDRKDLIVAHKPELLRLRDTDGDGRADVREVIATGWGYSDNYHDWTHGIVRDSKGNFYVGLGSDYSQPGRAKETTLWRGNVLRIDPKGNVSPIASGFRYPTGLAMTPDDQLFASDNQGVQNTFNEINHIVEGGRYGVPSLYDEKSSAPAIRPAIQLPHPWTRSVNGIFFLPAAFGGDAAKSQAAGNASRSGVSRTQPQPPSHPPTHPHAGQGIGCEYDTKFLVRFTLQRVGETYQGAVYPLSQVRTRDGEEQFLGTLCGGVSPSGDIYIGSIIDSGWLGGANVGDIVRLRPNGKLPLGIRELRAGPGEFVIDFTTPIDKAAAAKPENYDISGYTRHWEGAYATPDSGRHKLAVKAVSVASDGRSVTLRVDRQQEGHVYEVTCGRIGPDEKEALWPATGYYTMNVVPQSSGR